MTTKPAWIEMLHVDTATGRLAEVFDLVKTPHGTVDNVMRVHSLRPETMNGHVVLYRSVLHHPDITLPLHFLETVASYTSIINGCEYSLTHHFANARRLMKNEQRADAVFAALSARNPDAVFEGKELGLMRYAGKLTATPGEMVEEDLDEAREHGATDGEILEVNQVVAYFSYSNRLLNGLGVSLAGDTVGYYKE